MPLTRLDTGPRLSQAVVSNGFVFTAGVVPDSTAPDITVQAKEVLAKIESLLQRGGTNKSRIVSATIFLTDINNFAAMNAVWDAWLVPGQSPCRATVLAGLVRREWLLEIMVTAALPEARAAAGARKPAARKPAASKGKGRKKASKPKSRRKR
jgi:enamine deaminase RidA (YjgF/YER057c/UK114 family)